MNTAYDGLLHELQKQGAYLLNKAQTEQLVNIVLQPKKGGGHEVNKKWVGKDAARILETIGVHVPDTCRLAICEVPADHPFVLVEQMMPVLPIVRCQSFEQAGYSTQEFVGEELQTVDAQGNVVEDGMDE